MKRISFTPLVVGALIIAALAMNRHRRPDAPNYYILFHDPAAVGAVRYVGEIVADPLPDSLLHQVHD